MKTRLFTPGPVEIPARLLAALARPAIHHRTEGFRAILSEATKGMIELFGTEGTVVTLGASGSGGMEAAVVNLVEPGSRPLVVEAGKFGERWAKILKAYGVEPEVLTLRVGQGGRPRAGRRRARREQGEGRLLHAQRNLHGRAARRAARSPRSRRSTARSPSPTS